MSVLWRNPSSSTAAQQDNLSGELQITLQEAIDMISDSTHEKTMGDDVVHEETMGDDVVHEETIGDDVVHEETMGDDWFDWLV